MKMRRCEDEKMFYRPPLLEEPCAQTLSGKKSKKGGLPRQVESSSFGAFFASMVISNSILIGVSLEAQAVQGDNFAGAEENCGKTRVISPYFTKVPCQTGLFEAGQLVQTEFVPVHFGPK